MARSRPKLGHIEIPTRALLLIDFINDLEFPGGDRLLPHAMGAAKHAAALKKRAKDADIYTIYANDNFGQWRDEYREALEQVIDEKIERPEKI